MHWLEAGAPQREFERFVADSADQLLRTAYLMASDLPEAEDLVQETLLRVARRWHRVRTMDHPVAYARRVLVNLAIDGAEQHVRRQGELVLPDGAAGWDQADRHAERDIGAVDTQADLLEVLASLPARQRTVIVLRYWEDLPEAQVAAILGCPAGTVKSLAARGLARLRLAISASESGHSNCAVTPTSKGS